MTTALILAIHNRPTYLRQCLESLQRVKYPDKFLLLMIDDCSKDADTIAQFEAFNLDAVRVEKRRYEKNVGIKEVLKFGFEFCFNEGARVVINLDSDAIVKPEFVTRLLELKKQFPDNIVSGFNSENKDNGKLRNPIISKHEGYSLKQYANGINMCVNRANFERYLKPAFESKGNWDFEATKPNPCVIAVPSLVEHIGLQSSMGHSNNPDVAADFYQLHLPDVTLFGIDAHDPEGIKRAAEICTRNVKFGDVKIITERLFSGREAYSKFCLTKMVDYIETSHVLIIHPDGFIVNPSAWDNDWLQYDVIGATWGYKDNKNCGNGGFSLRSKKVLEIVAKLKLHNFHPEDEILGRQLRPMLEQQHGIKFAPDEVCNKFSIEAYGSQVWRDNSGYRGNQYCGSFGFHGYGVVGLPIEPAQRKGTAIRLQPHIQRKHRIR